MQPLTEIKRSKTHYEISMQVPGYTKDDVKVSLENSRLRIIGDKKYDDDKTCEILASEFPQRLEFDSSFRLRQDEFDLQGSSAEVLNGILRVRLPLKENSMPLQITVNGGV